MRILVLGGTKFLGRHIVEAALEAKHEVTLFNRGLTEPELYPTVERLIGDRDGGLEPLEGREWDAVIDTSGYVPRVVRQSVRLLEPACGMYCFISSISAYADFSAENQDEHAKTAKLEASPSDSEDVSQHYGALKALCEQEVQESYGERALIIRPGLIVGPYDPTDRFTYWPLRMSAGGETLIPGEPERPVQWIDARDLAAWIIRMLERKSGGIYNAVTPAYRYTMGDLTEACLKLAPDASPAWVKESFLTAAGVGEWIELPLWIKAESNMPGFLTVSSERAVASGLTFRPLPDTLRDTLVWAKTRPAGYEPKAGMDPAREAELLKQWREKLSQEA